MKMHFNSEEIFQYDSYGTDLSVSAEAYEELGFDIYEYEDMD